MANIFSSPTIDQMKANAGNASSILGTAPTVNQSLGTAAVASAPSIVATKVSTIPSNSTAYPKYQGNLAPGEVNIGTSTAPKVIGGSGPVSNPPTEPPAPLFNINTKTIPSSSFGTNTTASSVLNYRNQLQQSQDAYQQSVQQAQNGLYGLQQNAVNAGIYSPQETAAIQQNLQDNQAYRQGTLDVRGKPIPLEFQTGEQQQLDLQHQLTSQADTENAAFQEQLRQNSLQAAQANVQFGQQNYQNAFGQLQQNQSNQIAQGNLGVAQQNANYTGQNSAYGRYDYQQITDPTTGFPTIVTIDKVTGQQVGSYSPGQTNNTSTGSMGATGTGLGTGATNVFNTLGLQQDVSLSQAVQQFGAPAIAQALIQNEGGSVQGVNNNPGNIKFAGLPGQIDSGIKASDGGTFASYQTPQAGVQAIASIVQNAASGNSSAYGQTPTLGSFVGKYTNTAPQSQPTATGGYSYDQIAAAAPTLISNALKPLPDGGAYIDASLLADPKYAVMAQNFAKQAGIRVLSSADAATMNTVNQSISNLNQLASTFGNLAANSMIGKIGQTATNGLSKFFDTDYGSQLKAFQSDRDGLFQQIRTLAGNSPRLNGQELDIAANAIPNLNGGLGKDTLKDGINKLVKTQSYLDNAVRAIIPNYAGTPVSINGQYAVLGSDGKTYTFNDSSSATQFLQADHKQV